MSSLMANFETARQATETAYNSAGSATKELDNYTQSIQYSLDQMKAKFEELSVSLLDSDFLKGLIDTGTSALNIVTQLIDKLGILGTIFTVGGGIAGAKGHGLNHSIQAPFYKTA